MIMRSDAEVPQVVLPPLLGPKNTESVIGVSHEWVVDRARALGLPLLGSRKKYLVETTVFLAALRRDAEERASAAANDGQTGTDQPEDAEQLRQLLGMSRRG